MTKVDPLRKGIYSAAIGTIASSSFCAMKKSEDISFFIKDTIKPLKPKNKNTFEEIKLIPKYLSAILSKIPNKINSFLKSKNPEDKMLKKFIILSSLCFGAIGYMCDKKRENKILQKNKLKNPS